MPSLRSLGLVLCGTLWGTSLGTAAGQGNPARRGGPFGPARSVARIDAAAMSRGVELALRWGPISDMIAVPSLVDAGGLFIPTSDVLARHHPGPGDVERVTYRQPIGKRDLKFMRRPGNGV